MAFLVQGTVRKGLVVRDGKRPKRGPGGGSGTWPSSDYEDNDSWFHLAKIGLKLFLVQILLWKF